MRDALFPSPLRADVGCTPYSLSRSHTPLLIPEDAQSTLEYEYVSGLACYSVWQSACRPCTDPLVRERRVAPSRFTLIALRWFGDSSGDEDDVTIVEALEG